jgi:hypothetical protein
MFERRYTEAQREAIYKLKRRGKTGSQIARACAQGTHGLEGFEVGRDIANRIARQERAQREPSPLAQGDLPEAMRIVVQRAITIAEAWFEKQRYARGKMDTMGFRRMSASLIDLQKLLAQLPPDAPSANGHKLTGLVAQLAAAESLADGAGRD